MKNAVCAGACALYAGLGALAGPAASQVLAANETVETVVVTARLRPEDAQTVPVSLSVVDSAALTVSHTENTQQLPMLGPLPQLQLTKSPQHLLHDPRPGQQRGGYRAVQ